MNRRVSWLQYLERATDPRLLKKIPTLALILVTTLIHIFSSIDLEFSNFEIRIPLAVLSMVPAIFLIYLGHLVFSRTSKLKTLVIFLMYLIGGVIRGWVLETGLYELDVLTEDATAFRISTGALIVTVSAAVVSYVWSTLDDAWQSIITLHKETVNLKQSLENLASEIEAQDVEKSLNLFRRITGEISELISDSVTNKQLQLEQIVNQMIRPLSRNYAPKRILENITQVENPKITWRGVWKLFDPIRLLPSFRIVVWVLAIAAAVPVRRIYGWGTAIELGVLVMVSLYVSLFLINPIAQSAHAKFKSPLRELVMTLGFILVAIPPSIATTIALRDTKNPNAYLIAGIIAVPLFSWILTIGNAAWEYSLTLKTKLENTRDQQKWSLARLNLISWYKNGLISRLLHGPIQNSLQVAIMRVRAGDDEKANSNVIQTIIERINQAIASATDEKRSAQSDLIAMQDALRAWESVAKVQIAENKNSELALISDPAGCAIFTDIVMEACSNAIRHGISTEVKIDYHLTDLGIELRIRDNGKWDKSFSGTGLGEELLTSCSIWFQRSHVNGLNELALELPLGNQPPKNKSGNLELTRF